MCESRKGPREGDGRSYLGADIAIPFAHQFVSPWPSRRPGFTSILVFMFILTGHMDGESAMETPCLIQYHLWYYYGGAPSYTLSRLCPSSSAWLRLEYGAGKFCGIETRSGNGEPASLAPAEMCSAEMGRDGSLPGDGLSISCTDGPIPGAQPDGQRPGEPGN